MSSNEAIFREIAEDEQWLAGSLPAEAAAHELLKLRVKLEVQEQWLDAQAGGLAKEGVPQDLRASVRQAVLASAARQSSGQETPSRVWRLTLNVGLAAAAVLVFAFGLFWSSSSKMVGANAPTLNVFAYDTDEEDLDMQLEDALTELDDLVAARDDTDWDEVLEEM